MILYGFWRSSATWRVRIALHHKKLAFEYRPVDLGRQGGGAQHDAAYHAMNPMDQVPLLELDGQRRLGQSLAILEYLEETFPEPRLLPGDALGRARVRQLAEIVNSGIQPLQNTSVQSHVSSLGPDGKAWVVYWVSRGLAALETELLGSTGPFAVGAQPTFADLCIVPELSFARRFHIDVDRYPTLLRVEKACEPLEAFQKAHPDRQPDRPPPRGPGP